MELAEKETLITVDRTDPITVELEPSDWQTKRFPVVAAGQVVSLTIRVRRPLVPAVSVPGSRDERHLGVAVARAALIRSL